MPFGGAGKCSLHPSLQNEATTRTSPVAGLKVVEKTNGYYIVATGKDGRELPKGSIVFLNADTQEVDMVQNVASNLGFKLSPGGMVVVNCANGDNGTAINWSAKFPKLSKPQTNGNREWDLAITYYKGSLRLVAANKEGARIKHGNLLKFKKDGTIYAYHTINPILGLKTDRNGRLIINQ